MSRLRTIDKMVIAALVAGGMPTVLPVLGGATQVAAAPAPSNLTYVVKNGDYLTGIANKLKVAFSDLLTVNQLQPSSLILPGQQLTVPAGGVLPSTDKASAAATAAANPGSATATTTATAEQYVVKAGDSLHAIAGKLKVKLADLLTANDLKITSVILPGQKLNVPAGGVLPTAAAAAASAGPAAPAVTAGDLYIVQAGDYLFGIAAKLRVKLADLLSTNNLTVTSLILPGKALTVPAGGTLPPASATLTASTSAATPAAAAQVTGTSADAVVNFALSQVGKPYRFFAAGPDAYDCSGLVVAAFKQIGMGVVHQSLAQSMLGTPVDWINEAIKPGDLVFTARGGGDPTVVGHVGIAISATHWVHAPREGDVVKTGWIPADSKILAVRRLIPT